MDKNYFPGQGAGNLSLYADRRRTSGSQKGYPSVCAKKHNDVEFSIYTNSTLIDDEFCQEVVQLGNIAFQLSIEGTVETNDARLGRRSLRCGHECHGIYFKKYGIIFGTSICYTRNNVEAVTSDEFLKMITEKGARFGFYFHYMPVGK
ncbi:MAG: hypothetical protein V8R85_06815 [Frisingicoccus sp.]